MTISKITQIDEHVAWSLLRAVTPRNSTPPTTRAHHDPNPEVWLQVYPSGNWNTSSPPTEAARQLLDLYVPLTVHRDLTIAQIGQSLDSRIATVSGNSHYITGPDDIRHLHRLRAIVDAVIVGTRTIEIDNPKLTVREIDGPNPVRVVIDPDGRLDRNRLIFTDSAARTLRIIRGQPEATPNDDTICCRSGLSGALVPGDILNALRNRGYRRILIEGGGITVSHFLNAGIVDHLHVSVAPLLIGSGPPAFTLEPITTLDQAIRPPCRIFQLGKDVLFDLNLRRRDGA